MKEEILKEVDNSIMMKSGEWESDGKFKFIIRMKPMLEHTINLTTQKIIDIIERNMVEWHNRTCSQNIIESHKDLINKIKGGEKK